VKIIILTLTNKPVSLHCGVVHVNSLTKHAKHISDKMSQNFTTLSALH